MKRGDTVMSTYIKTVKLRCYPTDEQMDMLLIMFGHNRFIYNYMLNLQQFCYKHHKNSKTLPKHLSRFDMNKIVTRLKRKKRYSWLKQCESTSLQESCNNLDKAYERFFNKLGGFPRFKKLSYRQSYTSLCVNHNIKQLQNAVIKLPKLGYMKVQPYKIKGTIKSMTLVKTKRNQFFVNVVIQRGFKELPKTKKAIGIDLGLRNIANLSNGVKYQSLHFKALDRQIKLQQIKLSRRIINAKHQYIVDEHYKEKFDLPYYEGEQAFRNLKWFERRGVVEARQRLARLHEKKVNKRNDYLQKLSTKLVKQYDVIVFEKLSSSNMMKNHHLARVIGEQGWRMFVTMCQYKANWYGKRVELVSPRNTTQTCANCGYVMKYNEKLTLSVEHWQCPHCHVKHDRDTNAAQNILKLGLTTLNND